MDDLKSYTKELLRRSSLDTALKVASDNMLRTSRHNARLIRGIAVSSKSRVIARGLEFKLPLPLLVNHDAFVPLGVVRGISVRGDELHFEAEVANSMKLAAAEQLWPDIVLRENLRISIGYAEGTRSNDGVVVSARLEEISLVAEGADAKARIIKCWEKRNVVSLDGRGDGRGGAKHESVAHFRYHDAAP